MSFWVGIDLGTSGVKTVLIDENQRILADETVPLEVSRPRPGWSEQEPERWWQAALQTLDALAARHPAEIAALSGIGLSGQMHGATLLDAAGRPLRPCILWNDGRAQAECAALEARADFRGIAANLVMPGFTAPKLEWVRRHEPEIFARTRTVLLPKDYLRYRFSGAFVSDMSDAGGTLWLDVAGRRWSEPLLAATGLAPEHMPGLVEGNAAAAELARPLCERWGISRPPLIAGGGGDNAASACGVGAIAPGRGYLSLGTSGVLFVSTAACTPRPENAVHTFCHAVPGTWSQTGVILSATDCLNWLAELTGRSPEALARAAETGDPEAGVMFLPYLSGERTPHNDAGARGAFTGLSRAAGLADLAHAVFSGVAFALADCVDALRAAGAPAEEVFAIGGGARSEFWLQLIADATGLRIAVPGRRDLGAALGAARLALSATSGGDLSVFRAADIARTLVPRPDRQVAMAARRAAFRALYPALSDPGVRLSP
ncbi:MAG TPA: xylulokinase [Paracoccaceae bacterium]|nr:xylulokinase [Paracoccaceae bacterium]